MMGVLIKNMRMPSCCRNCYFERFGNCDLTDDKAAMEYEAKIIPDLSERPEWCPIVEVVTPHEDLIERPSEFLIKKVDKCLLIEYFKKIPAWVEAES